MSALNLSGAPKDGRTRKVTMNGTPGLIRVVTLPTGPLRLTVGPGYDATGAVVSGTVTASLAKAGTYTDGAAAVAVADGAIRADLAAGESRAVLVSHGLGEIALSSSVATGYVELTIEAQGA